MEFIYETQGNITFLVYEMSRNENLEPMTMGMIYISGDMLAHLKY